MLLMGWTFLSITLHNATSCKSDSQPRHGQPRRLELVGVARVENITPGLRILYENVVNIHVNICMSRVTSPTASHSLDNDNVWNF